MVGKVKRKKKSGLSIKIKPFLKPPTLPDNFYASSTEILWSSLRSILLRRSTIDVLPKTIFHASAQVSPKTSAGDPIITEATTMPASRSNLGSVPSREELYNQVQDLCTHGFGTKLYKELMQVLDDSAFICVQRLLEDAGDNEIATESKNSTLSMSSCTNYATKNCRSDGNQIFYTSTEEEQPASEGSLILENTWRMYSDYIQFLNCVRNVFMSLDRMFLYLPAKTSADQKDGKVLPRNATSSSTIDEETAEEGQQGNANAAVFTAGAGAWDMWDIGMHCLWKHLELKNTCSAMDCSKDVRKYTILYTVRMRIIQCILAELDLLQSKSPHAQPINPDISMGGNSQILHKSLVRNCVSIFRTLAFVSTGSDGEENVNKKFLRDLVIAMTSYLKSESQQWMSNSASSAPSKTSYDACSLLHHINNRLKQASGMTSYYHLANDASGGASSKRIRQNHILSHLVEELLLAPHFTPQLVLHPTNLYPILDQEKDSLKEDAKLLFSLSKRIAATISLPPITSRINSISSSPGMELLRQSFETYGIERGMAIMRMASTPVSMGNIAKSSQPLTTREVNNKVIVDLLRFKAHLEYLQGEAFACESFFGRTLRKVLEDVLNNGFVDPSNTAPGRRNRYANDSDGGKRVAELLAKYIDLRFKNAKSVLGSSSIKSSSLDSDLEVFQRAALDLFRYIQSKDVFEAFYRQDLAKRLLLKKSSSIDAERSFVSKLKAECGTGYTTKMEGMFKDMELSRDVMVTYSAYLSGNDNKLEKTSEKVDMEVQVLTTGYWPVRPLQYEPILPLPLSNKKEEFETYYKSKYQGRRIVWQNSLGNCIVKANFPKISGPRELNVSLLQALVLLCFNIDSAANDRIRLTISEVMKKTGVSERDEAERVLQSLSMGRAGTQVLRRLNGDKVNSESMDIDNAPRKKHKTLRKTISDSDIFVFNSDFVSNQRRIRITNIQIKETQEDRKKTHEAVTLDRLHLIDAAVVRIMKARKTLEHRDLTGEVMNQLKFPARGVDIKKRIESLIDREYLERTEGQASKYNYLA